MPIMIAIILTLMIQGCGVNGKPQYVNDRPPSKSLEY